jgi:hypothetical protein
MKCSSASGTTQQHPGILGLRDAPAANDQSVAQVTDFQQPARDQRGDARTNFVVSPG